MRRENDEPRGSAEPWAVSKERRKKRGWKRMLGDAPVAQPSVILPLDCNPRTISYYAAMLGMKFVWRKRPDGWHVWRIL